MGISIDSIMNKVDTYVKSEEGQQRCREVIAQMRKDGKTHTEAGSRILTEGDMIRLAEEMIRILKRNASNLVPRSVFDHFNSLDYEQPVISGKQGEYYSVLISFTDDLSRPSLRIKGGVRNGQRTGPGIENIVSLFDTGYDAEKTVFGIWEHNNKDIFVNKSTAHRDALGFMNDSIDEFNMLYANEYNVIAIIDANPKYYMR